jgi:hypothetical protein
MAACPKCGKSRVKRRKDKRRWCARCGSLRSGKFLFRHGVTQAIAKDDLAKFARHADIAAAIVGQLVLDQLTKK